MRSVLPDGAMAIGKIIHRDHLCAEFSPIGFYETLGLKDNDLSRIGLRNILFGGLKGHCSLVKLSERRRERIMEYEKHGADHVLECAPRSVFPIF